MSAFIDKQYYKDDSKHDSKHDVDGLEDTNDWEIRKDFDHYKSIRRIAENFFSFDEKKAWDNIKRINGLQKSNIERNVKLEGHYGLKDANDYNEVQEDIFNPIKKLEQTTINVKHDSQKKNKAVKTVLGNEDLNKMINSHFGGRTRSKKIRTRKLKKKYKNRRSKRQTTRMER
jgi:hypothetical protein